MSIDQLRFGQGKLKAPLPVSDKLTSYVLEAEQGESIFIPGANNITRILVSGNQTDNIFAVVGTRGGHTTPVPPHHHKEAHDVFLCLQGKVKVWCGSECRLLEQGDFASVPPGNTHSFQIVSNHSEFTGIIVPGGWEKFFSQIGEPYDGPLWPSSDERSFNVPAFIGAIKGGADVIPDRDFQLFEPNPDPASKPDNTLPDKTEPYFLLRETGPKYFLANECCSPLITPVQSHGKFAISVLEGSNEITGKRPWDRLTFTKTHIFFRVLEGKVALTISGRENDQQVLTAGESAFILAGDRFQYHFASAYGKALIFAAGGAGNGIETLFVGAGVRKDGHVLEKYVDGAESKLAEVTKASDIETA
ncbi:RmlC-like cupin [Meredithblackwellia eburnea MCA 4105]